MIKIGVSAIVLLLFVFVPAMAGFVNGGFETGNFTNWTTYIDDAPTSNTSLQVTTASKYTGTYGFEIIQNLTDDGNPSGSTPYGSISQVISTDLDNISFDYNIPDMNGAVCIELVFLETGFYSNCLNGTTEGWTHETINIADAFGEPGWRTTAPPTSTFGLNVMLVNPENTDNTIYNVTLYIDDFTTSANTTGFSQQDIEMWGAYDFTANFKDADTLDPIPVVTVIDSEGNNMTTSAGMFTHSYPYSVVVIYATSSGYYGASHSYVIDRDRTETVYLTQAVTPNTSANTNIVYVPKQIEITVMYYDPAGVVVPGAHVDLTAISNTLQADSQLQTLYGINPTAANQLMNGTLVMHGSSDASGGIVFTILQSINYQAQVTDPKDSKVYTATLFPGSDPYTIWIGTNPIKNTTIPNAVYMNQTKLFVTQPNEGNITDNLIYQDLAGKTTSVTFIVKYAANGTVAHTATQAVSGTNPVYMNYTHPNIRGMGIYYGWNATKVV